jgi:YhcH/YjgK/YiaL family protein
VFAFIQDDACAAPEGERIPLNGAGMFALVMRYDTRPPEKGVLEAHNAYIDVQASLEGGEYIEWFPRAVLAVEKPYDAEKDVVFFTRPGEAPARVYNVPGRFTVLFPDDAHMAQQCGIGSPAPVKKVVVKVPVSLLPAQEQLL